MITIVGLGNPGEEYKNTRHNAGRIIVERIVKSFDAKKFRFITPDDFMNNSGKAVAKAIKSKKDLASLVVIYDDLDLPMGSMKISFNRGDGGHNGLASVIRSVKSREFIRIRVGISPKKKPSGEKPVIDFLMKDFKDAEIVELKKVTKKISEALSCFADSGKEKMMSLYNS